MTISPPYHFVGEPLADGGYRLHTRDCAHRARGRRIAPETWLAGLRRHLADPSKPTYRACGLCDSVGHTTGAFELEMERLALGAYDAGEAKRMRNWLGTVAGVGVTVLDHDMREQDAARATERARWPRR